MLCMILRIHQFLIVSRSKWLLFRYHMVNTNDHHPCDGNDCFLVSAAFFDSAIFDCKIGLFFAPDCSKGTLYHHWFQIIACFGNPNRFFLTGRFVVRRRKTTPGTKMFCIIKDVHVYTVSARTMVELSSVMPGMVLTNSTNS